MPSTMAASPVRNGMHARRPQTRLATAAPFVRRGAGAGYWPAGDIGCDGGGGGNCDMGARCVSVRDGESGVPADAEDAPSASTRLAAAVGPYRTRCGTLPREAC